MATLKKLFDPRVLIPALIAIGAVIVLFSIGDPRKIFAQIGAFNRVYLLWFLLLMMVYEAIRFAQWWYLLREGGVRVPLRAQIFSFAGGEGTRFVPIGNYFQNYLLQVAEGADIAYTSGLTTLIILFEVAASLTGLLILGLDDWVWLRPLIVVGVAVAGALGWVLYRLHGTLAPPAWIRRRDRLHSGWEKAAGALRQFGKGASTVLRWRVLAICYVLAMAYLIAGAAALYIGLLGVGDTGAAFPAVLAVYFFSLTVGLLFPLPLDLGVIELSGVAAFVAVGVERNAAISAMLINRVLSIVSSAVITLVVAAIFRDELSKALHARGARNTDGGDSAARSSALVRTPMRRKMRAPRRRRLVSVTRQRRLERSH